MTLNPIPGLPRETLPLLWALFLQASPAPAQIHVLGDVDPPTPTNPTWSVAGNLTVGNTGAGSMTIDSGGLVESDRGVVGNQGGATGVVVVNSGGSWTNSNSIIVGAAGNAAGHIEISGSVSCQDANVGSAGNATGTVVVNSGGSWTINDTVNVGALDNATGHLVISGTVKTGLPGILPMSCSIGMMHNSSGTVVIDSGGSWISENALTVGFAMNSTGHLVINGTLSTYSGTIGLGWNSTGTVIVNPGGSWTNTHNLRLAMFGNATANLIINGGCVATGANSSMAMGGHEAIHAKVRLNGGVLQTGQVELISSKGTVEFIFNGGALRLSKNQSNLFSGFSAGQVTLAPGGGTIDTNGFNVTTNSTIGLSGAGALTKSGNGTLNLTGNNTYTGPTDVAAGTLLVNGALSGGGNVTVQSGATLGGDGTILGDVIVLNSGTLAPGNSPGILNTGNLSLNGTFAVELNGTAPGSGYDQVSVTGGVNLLGSSTLNITLGFTPTLGDLFFLIANDGADAISGTFSGLANNATFTVGSTQFQISYFGNSTANSFTGGNDLVLQVIPEPSSVALLALAGLGAAAVVRRRRR